MDFFSALSNYFLSMTLISVSLIFIYQQKENINKIEKNRINKCFFLSTISKSDTK